MQTSEKVRRWIKYKSNFLISAVPTLWNLRTDLRRRPKDRSDVPAETRGDLPRISLSSKEREKLHSFRLLMSGVCRPHPQKKTEEREFVVDSGASTHMSSRKDLNSAELETVGVSKGPTTVVTANGEVLTKRWANSVCQRIGFIRDSEASRRYTGCSITRKTLRRSRVLFPLDQWSETTSHQKWQTDRMHHGEQRTIRYPWSIDKFFKLIFTYISNIFIARSRNSHEASRINKKWEYEWGSTGKPVAWISRNRKPK